MKHLLLKFRFYIATGLLIEPHTTTIKFIFWPLTFTMTFHLLLGFILKDQPSFDSIALIALGAMVGASVAAVLNFSLAFMSSVSTEIDADKTLKKHMKEGQYMVGIYLLALAILVFA